MDTNEYGLIYGLTNHYFPGLVKIGMTHCLDISKRIGVLNTAVPLPFECAFAYKVPNANIGKIEHLLHDNYKDKRVGSSEFFEVEPCQVDKLIGTFGKFEAVKTMVQSAIDIDEARRKAPNMDFIKMGLHIGETLVFTKKPTIFCKVITNKKVLFENSEYSLSHLTHQLLKTKYAVKPSPYWQTEAGVPLTTLYIEYVKQAGEEVDTIHQQVHTAGSSVNADITSK